MHVGVYINKLTTQKVGNANKQSIKWNVGYNKGGENLKPYKPALIPATIATGPQQTKSVNTSRAILLARCISLALEALDPLTCRNILA